MRKFNEVNNRLPRFKSRTDSIYFVLDSMAAAEDSISIK